MIKKIRRRVGKLISGPQQKEVDPGIVDDLSPRDRAIVTRVRNYTMTSEARLASMIASTEYVVRAKVPGAFVECGVWRGGSAMAAMLRLLELGVNDRDFYLYDTFEGMTAPTEADVSEYSPPALATWKEAEKEGGKAWDPLFNAKVFNEQDVRAALVATGYPAERMHFVKGKVEETLPATLPAGVALLRLDTDWYESTRHELLHLYPLVPQGGVLIIDDYGHWEGCRKAVDEYFSQPGVTPLLLNRIDYCGRVAVRVK